MQCMLLPPQRNRSYAVLACRAACRSRKLTAAAADDPRALGGRKRQVLRRWKLALEYRRPQARRRGARAAAARPPPAPAARVRASVARSTSPGRSRCASHSCRKNSRSRGTVRRSSARPPERARCSGSTVMPKLVAVNVAHDRERFGQRLHFAERHELDEQAQLTLRSGVGHGRDPLDSSCAIGVVARG